MCEMDDKEAYTQRLKAAVHYTVGKICQSTATECEKQISKQAVAAIAETTFRQCEIFAKDLEAFARHAKRQTITVDDVKLLARRSTALSSHMQQKIEELAVTNQELKEKRKKVAAKRKSKEMEGNEVEETEN
ncbi:centromere protein S [Tachysurus fulvidraco]|uniref:centromere protein S n=1 Tax=Tachysurus fulvidraco TaxID=1234273 RepID=UPI001FEF4105|nr:centromere protein S [Tachysurus fulvidraco]